MLRAGRVANRRCWENEMRARTQVVGEPTHGPSPEHQQRHGNHKAGRSANVIGCLLSEGDRMNYSISKDLPKI